MRSEKNQKKVYLKNMEKRGRKGELEGGEEYKGKYNLSHFINIFYQILGRKLQVT